MHHFLGQAACAPTMTRRAGCLLATGGRQTVCMFYSASLVSSALCDAHGLMCDLATSPLQNPAEMEAMTLEAGGMDWGRTAVVLYCEFSSERGPRMFRHVRNLDRCRHLVVYPALAVPHMYVMSGGYKAFQVRISNYYQSAFEHGFKSNPSTQTRTPFELD